MTYSADEIRILHKVIASELKYLGLKEKEKLFLNLTRKMMQLCVDG